MATVNNLPASNFSIESLITKFSNLSRMKQIILGLMLLIILIFIYDIFTSKKQKYNNIENNPKKNSNNIEKLEPRISNSSGNVNQNSTTTTVGDIKIETEKTNVTLYFADWCGHCKQFIGSTWGKVKEKYTSNPDINLNQVDCTNLQTEIKTPAGMTIKGFPTVIINYKNADGEYVEEEYSGNRSYAAFSEYLDSLRA
jgi:thiol:disulfide interchange protein